MSRILYADIIIEISHEQVDRPFQYIIPDELSGVLRVGHCVLVPFGRGNKTVRGYCIGIKDKPDYPVEKLKTVIEICEDRMNIEGELIALAWWMKSHYGGTMIQALKCVVPVKSRFNALKARRVDLAIARDELVPLIEECENKHRTARLRMLGALLEEPVLPYELVRKKLNISAQTIKSLEDKGIITVTETEYYRNPVKPMSTADKRVVLSDEQAGIINKITDDIENDTPGKYLIHGITGSGKTEVYLGIAENVVKMGKQVIVLIPEISLTYQTLLRFYKRFADRVSVVNSSMSAGERYDQFLRAKNGDIDVIIGPRSALFTPFERLGAIIIDEEHETSYKSENTPRYHARECAEYLAQTRNAALIMGSATPSLEAYYKAELGIYTLFELNKRLTGGELADVSVVDMRDELHRGNRSVFSDRLYSLMEDRLAKGEQIMLFINRRGVSGFVSCRNCGYVVKCRHCDVSMTEHRGGRMVCHYCGYSEPKPVVCPSCGSKYIAGFKVGTEQIETQVKKMFPASRVLRMDADTTRNKGSMENILETFENHEADILVGTQMIVKGHDFPLVTLVGILAADLSLSVSDYHAAERTFELLTQAAGRAGRGRLHGDVVIQTYQPDHYGVKLAAEQDYKAFYEEEIAFRKLASYPPVWHLLAVLITSDDSLSGENAAARLKKTADDYIAEARLKNQNNGMNGYAIGPAPAQISRLKDKFRYVIYIKHADIDELAAIKDLMEENTRNYPDRHVSVLYDFDPAGSI